MSASRFSAPPSPRVVAVVPVFDGEAWLRPCVEALEATTDERVDILLVDDGSSDGSLTLAGDLAASSSGRVRVLALRRNHGFAGAVNRGVEFALAAAPAPGVIALVNQDCVVREGWLAPLTLALADPGVAVAGARLLEADGVTLAHAGARVEANALTAHLGRGDTDPLAFRQGADVEYVCGALVAMTTSTWLALGPLDEGYAPAYFEDVDFCAKARGRGLRVVYVPGSEAVHAEASTSGVGSRVFLARYHRGRLRFSVRHLLRGRRAVAWCRAELAWLSRRRRWSEVAPVLAAYAALPRFVWELAAERRAARAAADRAPHRSRAPRENGELEALR